MFYHKKKSSDEIVINKKKENYSTVYNCGYIGRWGTHNRDIYL